MPRILFEGWAPNDFAQLLNGPKEEKIALAKTLRKLCKQWKFDGFVLEILSQIPPGVKNEMVVSLLKFVGTCFCIHLLYFIIYYFFH